MMTWEVFVFPSLPYQLEENFIFSRSFWHSQKLLFSQREKLVAAVATAAAALMDDLVLVVSCYMLYVLQFQSFFSSGNNTVYSVQCARSTLIKELKRTFESSLLFLWGRTSNEKNLDFIYSITFLSGNDFNFSRVFFLLKFSSSPSFKLHSCVAVCKSFTLDNVNRIISINDYIIFTFHVNMFVDLSLDKMLTEIPTTKLLCVVPNNISAKSTRDEVSYEYEQEISIFI